MTEKTTASTTYIQVRSFRTEKGTEEAFAVIGATDRRMPFSQQLDAIWRRCQEYRQSVPSLCPVFERWFLSDSSQQQSAVEELRKGAENAVSIIEQPPLDGTKAALLVYLQSDTTTSVLKEGLFSASHGSYRHIWACSRKADGKSSREQAKELLISYGEQISEHGNTLSDNCIRTWFFVNDIDNNYHGVVTARNDVFSTQGLTRDTHFIASTGIGGRCAERGCSVMFDAYAVNGIVPEQIQYLQAPDYLNPTYEYGVSFERGTAVTYGDRKHVFISGTASIDNCGNIVHTGDVIGQTERMLQNVQALLRTAKAQMKDVMHAIVYLRDIADYQVVSELLENRLQGIPYVITYAPVCRPGWLIEMECMAITASGDSRFPAL